MGLLHEQYGSTLVCTPENLVKIEASTPEEILNFYNLHLWNSIGPHQGEGGTDIRCNRS